MRKYVLLKIEMAMVSPNGNIIRHCAQSAFRPAMVGIQARTRLCHAAK